MASIGYLEVFLVVVSFVLINRIANKGGLPKAWPILGLMPQFVLHVNDFHEWVSEIMEGSDRNFLAHGVVYLHSDMLFTVDPANINFMLTVDFANFPKGPEYKRIFEVLGDGIFNSDFGSWKSQRRMAQSFLSHGKTLSFLGEVMREKIENVLAKMLDEFSERCTIIDLQDLFDRLSLDLTCKLVTGFDQESLRIDLPGVEFSKALVEVEDAIFHRHVFPECTWKLLKMLGIGMERKLERAWQILDETAAEFIKLRRESLKNGVGQSEAKQGMDMLKSYITSTKGTDIIEQEDDGEDQFLRDTILNFMIAGRDTVSSALTWFFAMLSMNPLVESKIREEMDSLVMNESTLDLPLLEKMIPKMVYLHGALCESLRLYPPVPFQHKHPVKHITLPSGHSIGPGMKVLVPLYAMGRMKSTWGEDSLEVKPERWITERGGIRHEPSYKFLAFNAGPRTCIGKEVALRQVKTIIAFILHNYDVGVMEGQRLRPNNSIILRIRDGLRARIRKRRSGLS